MAVLTVKEILKQVIKQVGGDGLCETDIECGCILGDLAPCDGNVVNCKIAKNDKEYADAEGYGLWMEPIEFDDQTISVTLRKRSEGEDGNTNS